MIRFIEELSLNAWPSLEVVYYDGWILRFAEGYTKRANSIYPIYESTKDIESKIEKCEELYKNNNINISFKLTEQSLPHNLDETLSKRGYKLDNLSSVQTLDLGGLPNYEISNITYSTEFSEAWLNNYCRLSNLNEKQKSTLGKMLKNIKPQKYFVMLHDEGNIIGCGMGILEDGYLGLYEIVIDKNLRNKGLGEKLILNMLALGKSNGATHAYLQVLKNNLAALRLYEKTGFKEIYKYWFRIK